jgi:putative glycosyltransferase (TIGR04348 family)
MGRNSHLRDRFVKLVIVTPEAPRSTLGNAVTANRWAGILRQLGHDVTIALEWMTGVDDAYDVLIALHARRSHPSIERFRQAHASRPLIVALTGTDLYKDLPAGNAEAQQSLDLATRIVGLQEAAGESLPETIRPKLSIVYQSAVAPANPRPRRGDCFEVCILSHLRDVKDPLIAPFAARQLPSSSHIRIVHAGRALNSDWEAQAREEERVNPRYAWLGDHSHDETMQLLSGSRLLVLSSLMEGGANVIAEAVVCGVPVLCSKVPGNIGMLGRDYLGYFKPRDSWELRELLRSLEDEPRSWERLHHQVLALQPRFSPEAECEAWRRLLAAL